MAQFCELSRGVYVGSELTEMDFGFRDPILQEVRHAAAFVLTDNGAQYSVDFIPWIASLPIPIAILLTPLPQPSSRLTSQRR